MIPDYYDETGDESARVEIEMQALRDDMEAVLERLDVLDEMVGTLYHYMKIGFPVRPPREVVPGKEVEEKTEIEGV